MILSKKLGQFSEVLVGDKELGQNTVRYISLILMLASAVMGFITYTNEGWVSTSYVSYAPNIMTTFMALLMILPLYVRNVLKWSGYNVFTILSFVLNVSVTATMVSMLLGGSVNHSFFGGGFSMTLNWQTPTAMVLLGAILLSWLGMRLIAGFSWIIVFAVGTWNLAMAGGSLESIGAIFLLSAFLGIVLQNNLTPGVFLQELKYEFSGSGEVIKSNVSDFSSASAGMAKSAVNAYTGGAVEAISSAENRAENKDQNKIDASHSS